MYYISTIIVKIKQMWSQQLVPYNNFPVSVYPLKVEIKKKTWNIAIND